MGGLCSKANKDKQDGEEEIDYGLTHDEKKELEIDLKEVVDDPIFKRIDGQEKVTDMITADQINRDYLKHIFEGRSKEGLDELNKVRVQSKWTLQYEHDLLIAFWLAVHKEDILVTQTLIDWDPALRYISTIALKRKREKKPKKKVKEKKRTSINKQDEQTPTKIKTAPKKVEVSFPQNEGGFGSGLMSSAEISLMDIPKKPLLLQKNKQPSNDNTPKTSLPPIYPVRELNFNENFSSIVEEDPGEKTVKQSGQITSIMEVRQGSNSTISKRGFNLKPGESTFKRQKSSVRGSDKGAMRSQKKKQEDATPSERVDANIAEKEGNKDDGINFYSFNFAEQAQNVSVVDEIEAEQCEGGGEELNEIIMDGESADKVSSVEENTETEEQSSEEEEEDEYDEQDDGWDEPAPDDDGLSDGDLEEEDEDDDIFSPGSDVQMGSEFEGKQVEEKKAPPITLVDPDMEEYLAKMNITGLDIEKTEIRTEYQIRKLKVGFQLRFPVMMANIIKILLFREEIHLACYLTAFYEFALDEIMIKQAIDSDHYLWLNFVWAFQKNFIGERQNKTQITLHHLFDYITDICKKYNDSGRTDKPQGMKATNEIEKVCLWKLAYNEEAEETEDTQKEQSEEKKEDDNILKALLTHMEDSLALKFMGIYSRFLNDDLFLHSLKKNNKQFIQESLFMGAFDKQTFKKKEVVAQIIEYMQIGSKTIFLLNILILTDVSLWKNYQLMDLIEMFRNFTEETSLEENRLLLTHNPLMSIALSCELLIIIANSRKRFDNECNGLKDDLLELGKIYNSKIDDEEYFAGLIMDVDFQNRSVLKIITDCKLEPLMSEEDPKSENLMNNIYIGKEANQCDGNVYGYSTFIHILTTNYKKQTEAETKKDENENKQRSTKFDLSPYYQKMMKMITMDYSYKLQVDYAFQLRYRSKAINFYFMKEMILGSIICGLTLITYFDYLETFRGNDVYMKTDPQTLVTTVCKTEECYFVSNYDFYVLEPRPQFLTEKERGHHLEQKFEIYKNYAPIQYGISALLLLNFLLRMIFNLFKEQGVNMIKFDKYLNIDVIFAGTNAVVFWYITIQDHQVLENQTQKDRIDMLVVVVLLLAMSRFFMLFLVLPSISKMLLTLVAMLIDVLPFAFIMACYIVIATQLFSTQYQDINFERYGTIFQSFRTVFDTTLAAYSYVGAGDQELIYSAIMILHLFLLSILLLNFMIAILSTTYGLMLESGSFMYKCSLYEYCERFMIAFSDMAYGEIVIHSAPINIFCILLMPLTPARPVMERISVKFSVLIYWVENMFYIGVFVVFELALLPFIYLLTFINLILQSNSPGQIGLFTVLWLFFGIFVLIFILFRDVGNLCWILYQHDGCKAQMDQKSDEEDEEMPLEKQMSVFNDLRVNVIKMYTEIKQEAILAEAEDSETAAQDIKPVKIDVNHDVLGMLEEDEEADYEPGLFSVKISAIQEFWRDKKRNPEESDDEDEKEKKKKLQKQKTLRKMIEEKNEGEEDQEGENENQDNELEDMDDSMKKEEYPEDEDGEVHDLLSKFLIGSESSFLDTIDLVLMLKALPNKIVSYNIVQMKLFNFSILQNSLIAFQNADVVNAFEYFDEKNKDRVQKIRQCIMEQKDDLNDVKGLMDQIKELIQHNATTLEDFESMWQHKKETLRLKEEKKDKKKEVVQEKKRTPHKSKKDKHHRH